MAETPRGGEPTNEPMWAEILPEQRANGALNAMEARDTAGYAWLKSGAGKLAKGSKILGVGALGLLVLSAGAVLGAVYGYTVAMEKILKIPKKEMPKFLKEMFKKE